MTSEPSSQVQAVRIETGDGPVLPGDLGLPQQPAGIVVFAHGSGSSRLSPRNRHVAAALRQARFATLLFDLLTPEEAADRANVFDIPLLAGRVCDALRWIARQPALADLPVGLFGASTGAGAALVAAARMPGAVGAVVSRGGRPDMAGAALASVRAPVLLIVGGADTQVIALNRAAEAELTCVKAVEIVPGATHLFEEPGTLDAVVALAQGWFAAHLQTASRHDR
ncbi:dienelactone hydrolase family protein [Acidimangrovimonas pyrenivorans]|uniref:Dienelactone hydrolase family protein n=1 Tax=Acidimangrovimonas pyrenivorans TaxID=2030798 RepID=A0ABV7AGN8_9RHOB